MVTIRKIADYCGVSTATVSKALNHVNDIGEGTAKRIRKAASELGYMPNAAARSLKTRHTHNMGVVTALQDGRGHTHNFVARILSVIQVAAEEGGYDVTLVSSRINGMADSYLDHCRYRNIDGVAILCADYVSLPVIELVQSDIPCVCVDCLGTERSEVLTDNEQAMQQIVDYATEMGHRRIAFVHGEGTSYVTRVRVASFRKACAAKGLDVPESYVQSAVYNDFETARHATRRLLALPNPPTCILYPDDFAAIGGLDEIEAHGLRVPEDISAVGFDGSVFADTMRPRLTTFFQDADMIARESVRLLREAIETPKTYVPKQLLLPGRLLTGGTVGRIDPEFMAVTGHNKIKLEG